MALLTHGMYSYEFRKFSANKVSKSLIALIIGGGVLAKTFH
jgi:hypothetical protein